MRSWTQGLPILLAVALAGAGGAGLVLWLQKRPPTPAAQVQVPALASPAPVPAAPPEPTTKATQAPSTEDLVAKAMPAVVVVEASSGRGSAFFVDRERLITNHHVIDGQSSVKLRLSDNSTLYASIIATAPDYDLAMLRISQPGPDRAFLPLGSIQDVRQGQEVLAFGTPHGIFQNTVTRGIISSLRQINKVMVLQTDTAINPGSSGGPLIDHAGRVVGINTMGFRGSQGLNFAVAVDHARALMEGRPLQLALVTLPSNDGMKAFLPGGGASETERRREEGNKRYAAQLASLAHTADQLESVFANFLAYRWDGKVVGSFDRNFYAMWEKDALQGQPVKGYETRFSDLRHSADQLRNHLQDIEDQARRADVFPGTRRDLRQRYRLEHRGWD
jgi:hypothetical protein